MTLRFQSSVGVGACRGVVSHERKHKGGGEQVPTRNRGSRHRKVVMRGEVGGDAGECAELGTVGGEMGRAEERRVKAVKRLMAG